MIYQTYKLLFGLIISLWFFLSVTQSSFALPPKAYLPIPFLCQAPFGNWSQPWQDACEEAAIVMAMAYVKNQTLDRESGNREILALVDFQKKKYEGHFDLNAEKIVQLIKDYYHYQKVKAIYDPKVEEIKEELAKGHVVIAPMAGCLLGNPYYTPPGPVYHNLLFKGYDDQTGTFITNDAGTKRGRNYRYPYQVAFKAIHDWTGSKATMLEGRKVMVVITK